MRQWTCFPAYSHSGKYVFVTWPAPQIVNECGKSNVGVKTVQKEDFVVIKPAPTSPEKNSRIFRICNFERRKNLILDSRTFVRAIPTINNNLFSVTWSPDDKYVAGEGSSQCFVYKVKYGVLSLKIPKCIFGVPSWSSNSEFIAVQTQNGTEIWNIRNKKKVTEIPETARFWQCCLSWSYDSSKLCVIGRKDSNPSSNVLRVYDVNDGSQLLERNGNLPFCAQWTADGTSFLYADSNLHFLSTSTFKENFSINSGTNDEPMSFRCSPNGNLIAYNSGSKLSIYQRNPSKVITDIDCDKSGNFRFQWAPTNDKILIQNNTNMVAICETRTGAFLGSKQLNGPFITWTPEGNAILILDEQTDSIGIESCQFSHAEKNESVLVDGQTSNPWRNQKVPVKIEDCFDELEKLLSKEYREKIRQTKEAELFMFTGGPGLGMQLRNRWGLRGHTPLAKYFNQLGVTDGAQMSTIIITAYWRKLNSKAINLPELIGK